MVNGRRHNIGWKGRYRCGWIKRWRDGDTEIQMWMDQAEERRRYRDTEVDGSSGEETRYRDTEVEERRHCGEERMLCLDL